MEHTVQSTVCPYVCAQYGYQLYSPVLVPRRPLFNSSALPGLYLHTPLQCLVTSLRGGVQVGTPTLHIPLYCRTKQGNGIDGFFSRFLL